MKKLLIGAVSAVALSFALAATPALAGDASKICKANNDFGLTHGECTSLLAGGNSIAPVACKNYRDTQPALFDAQFKSLGDCVSYVRSVL